MKTTLEAVNETMPKNLPRIDIVFFIDETERQAAYYWKQRHKCKRYKTLFKKKKEKDFYWRIDESGIGESISVVCKVCGEEHDVTNYDRW